MTLKIYKHFDYASPFSAATSPDEIAEIMRLKYPKACSNLETGAEFFADMVEQVKKYEAWKYIGFGSFEQFCKEKLNKTIAEVEEIVEGVRILGGNPTESEAKKASRSKRAAELVRAGTHTVTEAAREVGISHQAASKAATKNEVTKNKVADHKPPQPTIKLSNDTARTARNIIDKMGAEYARNLATKIETIAAGRPEKERKYE